MSGGDLDPFKKAKKVASPFLLTLCCLVSNQLSAEEAITNQSFKAGPITFVDNGNSVLHLVGSDMYSNAIHLPFNGTIRSGSGTTNTLSGPILGSGTLIFGGADKSSFLTITNDAGTHFKGGVQIDSGVLNVSGRQPLGTGQITIFGGVLSFPANSTTHLSNGIDLLGVAAGQEPIVIPSGATTRLTGQLKASAPFSFSGPGSLILDSSDGNFFAGGFYLQDGGMIQTSGQNPLGDSSNQFYYEGGEISFTGAGNYPNGFTFNNGATIQMTNQSVNTITGSINGNSPITLEGAGSILNLLGQNSSYTGEWNLVSGTLATDQIDGLGRAGTVNFHGGALALLASLPFATPIKLVVNEAGGTVILEAGTSSRFSANGPSSISGNGFLAITGRQNEGDIGTVDLTYVDTSTFTGTFGIQTGANLKLSSPNQLNGRDILFNGGLLTLNSTSATYSNPMRLDGHGGTIVQTGALNTLSSNITGSGHLTYNGKGTLNLTDSNLHTGGTTVTGGIIIQTTGTNPLGAGPVNFNGGHITLTGPSAFSGPLAFNKAAHLLLNNTAVFSGPLSGSGGFMLDGGGTLTVFSTNNTHFTGPTTLTSGTLVTAGNAPLGKGVIILKSNGHLVLTGNTNLPNTLLLAENGTIHTEAGTTTLNGNAAGIGHVGLTKTGLGTLVFNGISGYSGPTNISSGAFVLNGSLMSHVFVHAGTTLHGTGTMTNTLNVSGTVSPGNGVGTLTAGNVIFHPNSTLQVLADRTNRSNLLSVGDVTIDPTARLVATIDPTFAGQYVVVQSLEGSVTGQFAPLFYQTPRLTISTLYLPQAVLLDVSFVPYAKLLRSGNLQNIAACFDQAALNQTPDMISVLDTLNSLTVGQLPAAFSQLDPSVYNVLSFAEESVSEKVRNTYTQHIYERVYDPEFLNDMFVTFFGEKVHQDSFDPIPSRSGYDDVFSGFLLGFDRFLDPDLIASAGFSYARSRVNWSHAPTKSTIDSYTGYIGASWLTTNLIVDAYGSYTLHAAKGSRSIFIEPNLPTAGSPFPAASTTPIDRKLTFKGDGECYTAHLGGISKQFVNHTPFYLLAYLDIDYLWIKQQEFTEQNGGVLSLQVQEKTADLLRPESGIGCGYAGSILSGEKAFIEVDVAYVGMFRFQGQKTKASFVDNDCIFHVKGIQPHHTLVRPTVRFGISSSLGFDVAFNYSGSFGNRYSENEGKIELTYLF